MEVTEEIDDIFGIQINQQNDPLYYNIYDVPLEYHQIREEQLRKEEEMKNEELKRNKQLQFEGIEIIVRLR